MRCWPNAGLMLVQRRRRWNNIKPALGQCVVLVGMWLLIRVSETLRANTRQWHMLVERSANVRDGGPTLNKHCVNPLCLLDNHLNIWSWNKCLNGHCILQNDALKILTNTIWKRQAFYDHHQTSENFQDHKLNFACAGQQQRSQKVYQLPSSLTRRPVLIHVYMTTRIHQEILQKNVFLMTYVTTIDLTWCVLNASISQCLFYLFYIRVIFFYFDFAIWQRIIVFFSIKQTFCVTNSII